MVRCFHTVLAAQSRLEECTSCVLPALLSSSHTVGSSSPAPPSVFGCSSPLRNASCLWSSSDTQFTSQEWVVGLTTYVVWRHHGYFRVHHASFGIWWYWPGTWTVMKWWPSFFWWDHVSDSGIRWSFMRLTRWIDDHLQRLSWVFRLSWSLNREWVPFTRAVPFCCWVVLPRCWFWHRELPRQDPHHQVTSTCLCWRDLPSQWRVSFPFDVFPGCTFGVVRASRPVWVQTIAFPARWWSSSGINESKLRSFECHLPSSWQRLLTSWGYFPGRCSSHTGCRVRHFYQWAGYQCSFYFSRPLHTGAWGSACLSATTGWSCWAFRFSLCSGRPIPSSPFSTVRAGWALPWSGPACESRVAWCGCSPGWSCVFMSFSFWGFTVRSGESWFFPWVRPGPEMSSGSGWRTCSWLTWLPRTAPWSVTVCFTFTLVSLSGPGSTAP